MAPVSTNKLVPNTSAVVVRRLDWCKKKRRIRGWWVADRHWPPACCQPAIATLHHDGRMATAGPKGGLPSRDLSIPAGVLVPPLKHIVLSVINQSAPSIVLSSGVSGTRFLHVACVIPISSLFVFSWFRDKGSWRRTCGVRANAPWVTTALSGSQPRS